MQVRESPSGWGLGTIALYRVHTYFGLLELGLGKRLRFFAMSAEQKSLLETDKSREADNTLHCYSATNSHAAIQHREMTPVTTKPRLTTENRLSAFSGDSLTSASMLGSVVQPRDLQELMSNLERATGLVKRYLQENQGLNSDRR